MGFSLKGGRAQIFSVVGVLVAGTLASKPLT